MLEHIIKTNITNDNSEDYVIRQHENGLEEDLLKYLKTYSVSYASFCGLYLNGYMLYVLGSKRKIKELKPPDNFLVNIALTNILVLVSGVPIIAIAWGFSESYLFGDVVCKGVQCVQEIALAATAITLISLSATTYVDIPNPPAPRIKRFVTSNTHTVVAKIWALAFAVAVPTTLVSHIIPTGDGMKLMNHCRPLESAYLDQNAYVRFLVYFAIPLSVIVYFNIMGKRDRKIKRYEQNHKQKELSKIVLTLVSVFAFSHILTHFTSLMLSTGKSKDTKLWSTLHELAYFLRFTYPFHTPLILSCVCRKFFAFDYMLTICLGAYGWLLPENRDQEEENQEPEQAALEPVQATVEPVVATRGQGQEAGEPVQAIGEPEKEAGEPVQATGEPEKETGEPAQVARE